MTGMSPTVANWELMLRIRSRADDQGLKTSTIVKALDVSQQYWSALNRGRGTLAEDKLKDLLSLLEFDAEEREELHALRDIAKGRHPFAEYSALFNEQLMRFYGLETGAQNIRSFESTLIPGLLQTEDYIRVLMKSRVTTYRPTEVEQRVSARLQRQRLLTAPDPVEFSVVIGQAALMYKVGDDDVRSRQLQHLISMAERYPGTIEIRIVPYEAGGAIASLNSATFHLLDFKSARLPMLGWAESAAYFEVVDDPKRVTALDYLFSQIQSHALDRERSIELIKQVASRS
ncbi:DUF5753 domain-containing protein [Nocardia tengchongensis]|uniref:DUF5753 domain-containing protein n=1 Tax=Nocardia tengchongensis TaxID=2055889 RepID=UPI00361418A1